MELAKSAIAGAGTVRVRSSHGFLNQSERDTLDEQAPAMCVGLWNQQSNSQPSVLWRAGLRVNGHDAGLSRLFRDASHYALEQ